MDNALRGAAAISASDFLKAVAEYTKALVQHPTSPDYYIQRSIAFSRLKPPRHDLSLKDAEYAVLFAQKRAKRENIQAAQQRRVVALYGLGQYADAAFLLETMIKWRKADNKKDKMEGDMWKAKIEQKMETLPAGENQEVTVKEYPEIDLPSDSELERLHRAQLKADGTFRFDGENDVEVVAEPEPDQTNVHETKDIASKSEEANENSGPAGASRPPPSKTTVSELSKIRHEWYQNPSSVIITLYAKGVPKDKADIDVQDDSIFVSFPHPSNPASTFTFSLDPLFALIDPTKSTSRIVSTKVELTLHKKFAGQKWPGLEGSVPLKDATNRSSFEAAAAAGSISTFARPAATKTETAPSYPTSARTGPKDWDKLATDLTAKKKKPTPTDEKAKAKAANSDNEEDYDSDFEGGDPVDGFFKKLYAGADDDTRRAMMKSFQESHGTALSTNWAEVGKGPVKPVESKSDAD